MMNSSNHMLWVIYDTDSKRAREISVLLNIRCGVQALPYDDAGEILNDRNTVATFLVHCDAVRREFDRVAGLKGSRGHLLRFYCTDQKDRIPQVACLPQDLEKLIS